MAFFWFLFVLFSIGFSELISNISCPANAACIIDCESIKCQNSVINATESKSLHVTCGNCFSSTIICPLGDSSNSLSTCVVDISSYAQNNSITARRSSFMNISSLLNNNLTINADHESTFHHSQILCGDNSKCVLNCNSIETCLNIDINITLNSDIVVNCNGSASCNYLDGGNNINSNNNDKSVSIKCNEYTQCIWNISNISGDLTIDTDAAMDKYYNSPIYMDMIDAVDSNSVIMNVNRPFISKYGVHANNSKYIQINVTSSNTIPFYSTPAYFKGTIFGQNTTYFELGCSGNSQGCVNGTYFISTNNVTKIICEDDGCFDLEIYSINGMDNVIVVKDGNDTSCISHWDIYCGNNYDKHSVFGNGKCSPDKHCCGNVVNHTRNDFHCPSSTEGLSTTTRVLILIGGVILCCLISGGIFRICSKGDKKVYDKDQLLQEEESSLKMLD